MLLITLIMMMMEWLMKAEKMDLIMMKIGLHILDLNGNGLWDSEENEPLNNDVGQDGVGPFDLQYIGPDEGEGDGIPTDGEPNFDKTDKDESDQIGLTSLSIYRFGDGGTGGGWPKDDEVNVA